MPSQLPISSELRTRILLMLRPVTKWGRATLWLGILTLVTWLSYLVGVKVCGWAELFTVAFCFVGLWTLVKVGYRPLMWRLRNRLVVTYLFIGVMPILLLLAMVGIAGLLFAGQFAAY